MNESLKELEVHVSNSLSGKVGEGQIAHAELTFQVEARHLCEVMQFLKNDSYTRFVNLVDICGVDYPEREKRFDVVYHLLSPSQNMRVRLKVATDEHTPIPSVLSVFPGALWFEREAFDLYGILFSDHGDLRRLLTDYGFEGHPLRKDFPVTGYVEVRYDEELKKVVYEPVKLAQEYRDFDFLSPWEGSDYLLPGDEKTTEQDTKG